MTFQNIVASLMSEAAKRSQAVTSDTDPPVENQSQTAMMTTGTTAQQQLLIQNTEQMVDLLESIDQTMSDFVGQSEENKDSITRKIDEQNTTLKRLLEFFQKITEQKERQASEQRFETERRAFEMQPSYEMPEPKKGSAKKLIEATNSWLDDLTAGMAIALGFRTMAPIAMGILKASVATVSAFLVTAATKWILNQFDFSPETTLGDKVSIILNTIFEKSINALTMTWDVIIGVIEKQLDINLTLSPGMKKVREDLINLINNGFKTITSIFGGGIDLIVKGVDKTFADTTGFLEQFKAERERKGLQRNLRDNMNRISDLEDEIQKAIEQGDILRAQKLEEEKKSLEIANEFLVNNIDRVREQEKKLKEETKKLLDQNPFSILNFTAEEWNELGEMWHEQLTDIKKGFQDGYLTGLKRLVEQVLRDDEFGTRESFDYQKSIEQFWSDVAELKNQTFTAITDGMDAITSMIKNVILTIHKFFSSITSAEFWSKQIAKIPKIDFGFGDILQGLRDSLYNTFIDPLVDGMEHRKQLKALHNPHTDPPRAEPPKVEWVSPAERDSYRPSELTPITPTSFENRNVRIQKAQFDINEAQKNMSPINKDPAQNLNYSPRRTVNISSVSNIAVASPYQGSGSGPERYRYSRWHGG